MSAARVPRSDPPTLKRVISAWWPLAISWLLMSAEPAALSAVVARLANPEIHLAAYGSVAFPLIGMVHAPVLTLLSLSTAMSKDWDSFVKGRRLMFYLAGALTIIFLLITFTPLYYVIVEGIIGAPPEIVEPARISMMFGVPWTFAVAYRRFHQGVLIRFEHSRAVTVGTMLRFLADTLVIIFAFTVGGIPGSVLATVMMVCGVVTEAVYVGWRVRPVLKFEVRNVPRIGLAVSLWEMVVFFIPLGLMPLLNQLIRPIGSAALSRMPNPIETLAIWPVVASLSWLIVTPGSAYNEVVIAMLDRPGAKKTLMRFMYILMGVQFTLMLLLALTPLSRLWFAYVSGLKPELAELAARAFILLVPVGLLSPLNSWYTGAILHSRRSRSVTEGMGIYLGVYTAALILGGALVDVSGIYVAIAASVLSALAQNGWLWFRSREALRVLDAEQPREPL